MNERIIFKLKTLYKGISNIFSFERIEKGFLSENYKVYTKEHNFFLKRYRFKDKERIMEVHSVKKYFNEKGIPVIMPIETLKNETFFEFDNSYYALFPFVNGVQPERGALTESQIVSLGNMLGKVHLAGKSSLLKIHDYFKGWDKQEAFNIIDQLEYKLSQIKHKSEFDILAQKNIELKKELIAKNAILYNDLKGEDDHLVHGDYLDSNVFFDDEEHVKYVFDFEMTKRAPRTQELLRSAIYSLLSTDFDNKSLRDIALYIKSYSEVYPIEKDQLKGGFLIYYLKSAHDFWIEKEHYIKENNRVDLFLESSYKRLRFFTPERFNNFLEQS